jgi:hypothetical protein
MSSLHNLTGAPVMCRMGAPAALGYWGYARRRLRVGAAFRRLSLRPSFAQPRGLRARTGSALSAFLNLLRQGRLPMATIARGPASAHSDGSAPCRGCRHRQ